MKLTVHKVLTFLIAMVWFINGLFAKVLNFVPRHEQIVSRVLGDEYAALIIKSIGIAEIFMAMWILSRVKSRLNAFVQISLVATMNVLEFAVARDLLLWGGLNALFALLFIVAVYYNEFVLSKNLSEKS